jgi:hypothetical protein
MANYSIALGSQPPQIDVGNALALAAQMQRQKAAEAQAQQGMELERERFGLQQQQLAAQIQQQELAGQRAQQGMELDRQRFGLQQQQFGLQRSEHETAQEAQQAQRNALAEYTKAQQGGDENALSRLSAYPELQQRVLQVRGQMEESERGQFDQKLIRNARRAQQVMGVQGEAKQQAWMGALDDAVQSGDITPQMYEQYAAQPPNDLMLQNIVEQAVPIQNLYQAPTAKMQELEAAGIEQGTPEFRQAILPSPFADEPAAVKEYALAKREGFEGNFTDFLKEKKGPLVTIDNKGEEEYVKTRGKALAEDFGTIQTQSQQATDRIGQLRQIDELLSNPNVYTGTGAQAINALKRTAQTLFGQDSIEGVADADAARRISTEMALSLKENLPGPMSDSDREFLQGIPPGIGDTAQGRKLLVELMTAKEQRKIETAELAREYAEQNNGRLDDGWYTALARYNVQNPVFSQEQMEQARTVAGQGQQQSPAAGVLPRVTDVKSYNAVPPGARYIAPDGRVKTKGGGR